MLSSGYGSGLGLDETCFQVPALPLPSCESSASHLTSLSLSFFICQMRQTSQAPHRAEVRI